MMLIPLSNVSAISSWSSQVNGKYHNVPNGKWEIWVQYLKTTIYPSTGHIEGEVRFTIKANNEGEYTRVKKFYLFGDASECGADCEEEIYGDYTYYVEYEDGWAETYTEYIDMYVDSEWDDEYSTTLRIEVYSNGFPDNTRRFIYEQVYWVKVGSVYWALSSGFCCSISEPSDLEV